MRSFEQQIIEVSARRAWHLFTGSIVLTFGSAGGLLLVGWLIAV